MSSSSRPGLTARPTPNSPLKLSTSASIRVGARVTSNLIWMHCTGSIGMSEFPVMTTSTEHLNPARHSFYPSATTSLILHLSSQQLSVTSKQSASGRRNHHRKWKVGHHRMDSGIFLHPRLGVVASQFLLFINFLSPSRSLQVVRHHKRSASATRKHHRMDSETINPLQSPAGLIPIIL